MYIYNILAEKHKITITYKTFHYHIRKMNILEFRKYKKQPHNGKKTLPVSRNVTFNLTYAAEKDLAMQKKLAEEENFLNKPSDMPDDAVQKLVDDLI